MSGSNEFLWELSCVSNSSWLTYKGCKTIKDVCHMYKLCLPPGADCVGKGPEGLPSLWGMRSRTQMEFLSSTGIFRFGKEMQKRGNIF